MFILFETNKVTGEKLKPFYHTNDANVNPKYLDMGVHEWRTMTDTHIIKIEIMRASVDQPVGQTS